jgi:ATP-dependent RNA helicase HelY
VPKHFDHRSPQARRDLASSLRNARPGDAVPRGRRARSTAADDAEITRLRKEIRQHPCQGCADREEHARWAERYTRLRRDTAGLRTRVENRTHSIARTFDQVCALLQARGYLGAGTEPGGVTPAGRQLARIWSESDLLVAECVRSGVWEELSAAELAAAVSALVYESRREAEAPARLPEGPVRAALEATRELWADLEADEQRHGLTLTREPDLGFAWAAYRWARGESLDRVLGSAAASGLELSAGDFVRWCKQLLDLLDQLAGVAAAGSRLAVTAREAVAAVRRGVVASTGTV